MRCLHPLRCDDLCNPSGCENRLSVQVVLLTCSDIPVSEQVASRKHLIRSMKRKEAESSVAKEMKIHWRAEFAPSAPADC